MVDIAVHPNKKGIESPRALRNQSSRRGESATAKLLSSTFEIPPIKDFTITGLHFATAPSYDIFGNRFNPPDFVNSPRHGEATVFG